MNNPIIKIIQYIHLDSIYFKVIEIDEVDCFVNNYYKFSILFFFISLWNFLHTDYFYLIYSLQKEQVYQVQRDPITNPLDHVFHLRSYTWTLASDEKYICEIRYQPLVAFSKNVDYFVIIDTSMECTKIITYGCSIGIYLKICIL